MNFVGTKKNTYVDRAKRITDLRQQLELLETDGLIPPVKHNVSHLAFKAGRPSLVHPGKSIWTEALPMSNSQSCYSIT